MIANSKVYLKAAEMICCEREERRHLLKSICSYITEWDHVFSATYLECWIPFYPVREDISVENERIRDCHTPRAFMFRDPQSVLCISGNDLDLGRSTNWKRALPLYHSSGSYPGPGTSTRYLLFVRHTSQLKPYCRKSFSLVLIAVSCTYPHGWEHDHAIPSRFHYIAHMREEPVQLASNKIWLSKNLPFFPLANLKPHWGGQIGGLFPTIYKDNNSFFWKEKPLRNGSAKGNCCWHRTFGK